jgi:uncharacterized protein
MKKQLYKSSNYNHFFQLKDGAVLAYNAFSNSLANINQQDFASIQEILNFPNQADNLEKRKVDLKNNLIKGGFLIDHLFEEFEILKAQNRIGRFSGQELNLTVAPTLSCNFKCTYCFENPRSNSMTTEVEKALIEFVSNKMKKFKRLQVSWFGGEPLLKVEIIERLREAFREICELNSAVFSPSAIITNGYLLSREVAIRLKKANIDFVQVTVDGIPEIHNKRRKLVGNNQKGTFRNIIENIKSVSDLLSIQVRVNVDRESSNYMEEFFDLWISEGLASKVPFYFGQVQANTNACSDNAFQCYNTREYSQLIVELTRKAQERGIIKVKYPSLYKNGFCCADNLNGYVIAPSGHIFKCWEEISENENHSIGNLLSLRPSPAQTMNASKYLNWDPFLNSDCKSCKIFPVCGGGCVFHGLNSNQKKECNFWKYNLGDMLKLKVNETIKAECKCNQGG